ncbi:MAG: peptidoglycan DD-metalloendopeptidase family protein [Schleiferiaceae bacterium]|nr:peptidoglycan DD-metalloendopeptidase family protein [Schleiferiaceae bacterium]
MRVLNFKSALCILAMGAVSLSSWAQQPLSKEKLEQRKVQLQDEIEVANTILKKTQKDKELSLGQVRALDKKVRARQELIRTVQAQIQNSDREIRRLKNDMARLDGEIKTLKEKYAGMLREAQKRGTPSSALSFVFASDDLQQALKRLYFLRQYSGFRQTQVEEIKALQVEKAKAITALEAEQGRKRQLLGQELAQKQELVSEKSQQEAAVAKLKNKESQITTDIKKKRSELQKLEKQIQKIIQDELKRQREAARKQAEAQNPGSTMNTSSSSTSFALTPEGAALAKDFAANKGKLPWPVERGIITQNFGENPVPGTSGVTIKNPGVDIGTPSKSSVRAVFNGEVSTVVRIPGANRVVLIRHGNYFTVYSNLDEVFVKTGDKVNTKDAIGRVAADPETGESTLHFELWMDTNNQDPKPWLGR